MPDLTLSVERLLQQFEISHTSDQVRKLSDYVILLDKWNATYNLTAVRSKEEMLDRHIADSLSIASSLQGQRFIDIGTGPGLPGIPLAIVFPHRQFVLLDSNGKKTRFLMEAKRQLGLDNVEVVNDRAEHYQPTEAFDGVLSRAFASLEDMVNRTDDLCRAGGHFYAMKGQYPETELQAITKPYKVLPLQWAGNTSDRHLVIISQDRG